MRKSFLAAVGTFAVLIACSSFCLAFRAPQTNAKTTMTQQQNIPAGPVVDIKTTLGDIKIKLYDDTPIHRDNFLKLAREGFYDGVLFHRVIKDFMVQTGDPNSKTADSTTMLGEGDPNYTLEAEILYPKHYHKYGALAAARTGDNFNPERRSSGSQFYIVTGKKFAPTQLDAMAERKNMEAKQKYFNQLAMQYRDSIMSMQQKRDSVGLEDLRQKLIAQTEAEVKSEGIPENIRNDYSTIGGTPHLDGAYTVFGEVIQGMETVEKIQNVETGNADRPKEDVRIISIKIEK